MGNICNKLCNQEVTTSNANEPSTKNLDPKNIEQPADSSMYCIDPTTGKQVLQSSLFQRRIQMKIRRPSGIHFKNLREKLRLASTEELERPCRSKEDLRHIYKFQTKNIGEGGFGYVCKACLHSNPEMIYAIKQIDKNQHPDDLEIFLQEIELMKVLDHPNIVKFFQVYEDDDFFYMVLEFLDGGELIERMEESPRFNESEIKNYFWQMLLAVRYMNKRRLAHRDIKPENFMFKTRNGKVLKLIDFGLSQCFDHKKKMKTLAGSPYYLAPEVLQQEYTYKCDVWSLGVILYEMTTGDLPFYAENNNELFELIKKGKYDTKIFKSMDISPALIDLMTRMLIVDDDDRICIEEALNHSWFNSNIKERLSGLKFLNNTMLQNMRDFTVNSQIQREMIGLMVQSFHDHEELSTLVKVFNALDTDYSGTLQKNEIMKLYIDRGVEITEEEVEDIIDSLYIKEQGIISFLEFKAANLDRDFYAEEGRLKVFFGFLDLDGSGEIEAKEISDVFKRFGRNLSQKKIQRMIKEVDKNADSKIDFEEFKVIMNFHSVNKANKNSLPKAIQVISEEEEDDELLGESNIDNDVKENQRDEIKTENDTKLE